MSAKLKFDKEEGERICGVNNLGLHLVDLSRPLGQKHSHRVIKKGQSFM